jgi:hypothetical protein
MPPPSRENQVYVATKGAATNEIRAAFVQSAHALMIWLSSQNVFMARKLALE